MSTNRIKQVNDYAFEAKHPHPGLDPVSRLRHTLDVFAGQPDDRQVLRATSGIYGEGEWTGITLGDLRAIADLLPPPVDPAA